MGKREEKLKKELNSKFGKRKYSKPKETDFFNSRFHSEIDNVYRNLGGILPDYPTNFRSYDIQCENFILELDEERHFNRYRLHTLYSTFYTENDIFFNLSFYKKLCVEKESNCLKSASWSKNWETPSTKKQFGKSDKEKHLGELGASRWKQRAFYDYLRDVSSVMMRIPIIRISVWELIDNVTINNLMELNKFEEIINYIEKQINYD